MSGADLLPCPFCGAEPPDVHFSQITKRIFCEGCGADGPWCPAFHGDWNTRVPVQEPPSPGVTAEATGEEQVAWPGPGRFTDLPKRLRRAAQLVFADDLTEGWRQWISDVAEDAALKIEALERDLATPAPVVPAEGLERALLAHHEWHQRLGVIVFPPEDDQDGPTEIDMSAEYADSRLHEQTVAALSGASIVQSVDDHAHAALSHALQYLRGEAPNVMSGGHRNGQLRSMIKWVLLGCGGPLRSAPPVGARVTVQEAARVLLDAIGDYDRNRGHSDYDPSLPVGDALLSALAALLPAGEGEE